VRVSWEEGLASDHVALLFDVYPSDSIVLIPAPAPNGYKAKPENWVLWVEVFAMLFPLCLPYTPPHSTVPVDPSIICHGVTAHEHLETLVKAFDNAVEEACKRTLKPKCAPNPKGTTWWNKKCTKAHILAHNAQDGAERHQATKALHNALANTKREWAHKHLNEAKKLENI